MQWPAEALAVPMARAARFFFDLHSLHGGREGVILRILALKYAACRLFSLQTQKDFAAMAKEASTYLAHVHGLASHLTPHETLLRFFRTARARPERLRLPEVLKAVLTLPY
jgi:ABC-type transport system involved in cytochrome c biogenesis ATPase subunit